jgi:hypothetical protein
MGSLPMKSTVMKVKTTKSVGPDELLIELQKQTEMLDDLCCWMENIHDQLMALNAQFCFGERTVN